MSSYPSMQESNLISEVDTGSSVLFGAFLSGLTVTSLQDVAKKGQSEDEPEHRFSCGDIYARTIGPLQQAILAPLFFASIGYGIVSVFCKPLRRLLTFCALSHSSPSGALSSYGVVSCMRCSWPQANLLSVSRSYSGHFGPRQAARALIRSVSKTQCSLRCSLV